MIAFATVGLGVRGTRAPAGRARRPAAPTRAEEVSQMATKESKEEQTEYETDPVRIDGMKAVLRALAGRETVGDVLAQDDKQREIAEELGLPFLELHLTVEEHVDDALREPEIREWVEWSARVEARRRKVTR